MIDCDPNKFSLSAINECKIRHNICGGGEYVKCVDKLIGYECQCMTSTHHYFHGIGCGKNHFFSPIDR